MVEANAGCEGETEVKASNASKFTACIDRINEAVAELIGLELADTREALLIQLEAIDLHRRVALDLIKKLRPDGVSRLFGIDPVDLFVIVHLDAQTAPVSQNSIVSAIRNRYPARRADCAARLCRLEKNGVIERAKEVRGRGGGIRWALVDEQWIDGRNKMRKLEERIDSGIEPLPSWDAGDGVYAVGSSATRSTHPVGTPIRWFRKL